jgi:outer membrane protein
MKRIYIVLSLLFCTTVIINAQFVAGGSIGFSSSGGTTENNGNKTDNTSTSTFTFSPMVGKFFSSNFLGGIKLGISSTHTDKPSANTTTSESNFGITPFARYYALRVNKFSIFGQAELGIGFGSDKTKVNGTTTSNPKTSSFSLIAYPGIAYDLTDKVQLEASIGGFNFGFYNQVEKDDNYTQRNHNFGFGLDLTDIATTGSINIGAIIKF